MANIMLFTMTCSTYASVKIRILLEAALAYFFYCLCENLSSASRKSKYLYLSTNPFLYRYFRAFPAFMANDVREDMPVDDEWPQVLAVFLGVFFGNQFLEPFQHHYVLSIV